MSEPDPNAGAENAKGDEPAQPAQSKRLMSKLGGASIGGAMVGLEAAVFRTIPPPIEVVEQNRHDGPMVTGDGTILTITMPDAIGSTEPAVSPPPRTSRGSDASVAGVNWWLSSHDA